MKINKVANLPLTEILLDSIPSTQKWCLSNIRNLELKYDFSPHMWVCVRAKEQTQGIGQTLRNSSKDLVENEWIHNSGNIAVSYVVAWPQKKLTFLSVVPLVIAEAICRVLEKFDIVCNIKWVNDVLVQSKKIAGVLVSSSNYEIKILENDEVYIPLILGIGINMHEPPEIYDNYRNKKLPTTSFFTELKNTSYKSNVDPTKVEELLNLYVYETMTELETRGFSNLHKCINKRLLYINTHVKLIVDKEDKTDSEIMEGKLLGISELSGCLQIQKADELINVAHGRLC